ncbi:SCP2 sterol-binding domain-containing protein [Shouchella miscanthi]|uniref:SCP2 sterol-binding domain-containing protein n=1 Tax=Shouchella miscanthi TaxID=2598861 RepID=UPI00119DB86A|nr:SCP2 sterol-binding domain-containing protein [Shouchella miscanthi]
MKTEEKLYALANQINNHPDNIRDFNRSYQFELKPEARYSVTFSNGAVTIEKEPIKNEEACILKLSEANLHKLLEGNWNPTVAYMTGQLKVDGDVRHALKLHEIVKQYTG